MSNVVQTVPRRVGEHTATGELPPTLYARGLKRAFDVVVAATLLLLGLPLIATLAIVVRLVLGRGIFYSQERVGLDGRPFRIVKFRTMHPDRRRAEQDVHSDRRQEHKTGHDPRHTSLGRLLRLTSLDELPQLWNVLRGDMSLVGPRPEIFEIAQRRGYLDHVRHTVRPGMTGPYQLSPLRFDGDLRDGLDLDEQYVRRITFRRDLGYLLRTLIVLRPTNGGS